MNLLSNLTTKLVLKITVILWADSFVVLFEWRLIRREAYWRLGTKSELSVSNEMLQQASLSLNRHHVRNENAPALTLTLSHIHFKKSQTQIPLIMKVQPNYPELQTIIDKTNWLRSSTSFKRCTKLLCLKLNEP